MGCRPVDVVKPVSSPRAGALAGLQRSKAMRDRKRGGGHKVEGRKSHVERRPEAMAMASAYSEPIR